MSVSRSGGLIDLTGTEEYRRAVNGLIKETKKTTQEFLRWRASIVTHDLIDFTPPRGKNPSGESWSEQRQRGKLNVERDIKKVFKTGSDLWDVLKLHPLVQARPKLAEILIRYINAKDYANLSRVLYKMGSKIVLIPAPLMEQHFAERSPVTGRVRKPKHHYYMLADNKRDSYIVLIQKDVGKMKHGWMAAAEYLGTKDIPQWVQNQNAPKGSIIDLSHHVGTPSITIYSDAKGIGRFPDIVEKVVAIQQNKAVKEYEAKLAHAIRKHGAHHH